MSLGPHHKVLIGLLFGSILCIIVFFVGILPVVRQLQSLSSSIEQARIVAAIARQEQQNDAITEREYERLKTTGADLDKYFVKETSILEFVTTLEDLSSKNHVNQEIKSLQPPAKGVTESQVDIVATGSFANLLQYVGSLEAMTVYLSIQSLTWSKSEDGQMQSLSIQATLSWQ